MLYCRAVIFPGLLPRRDSVWTLVSYLGWVINLTILLSTFTSVRFDSLYFMFSCFCWLRLCVSSVLILWCVNLQDGSEGLPVTIGLAAATGFGILAYTEVSNTRHSFVSWRVASVSLLYHVWYVLQIETVLQFLGSAAIVQLVVNNLLYAEVFISFFSSQWASEIWIATFYFVLKMIFVNEQPISAAHRTGRRPCNRLMTSLTRRLLQRSLLMKLR